MKNRFSISETAAIVGMTSETLRHYDRIELVKPSQKDESNGYRYYMPHDIIRLNTIKMLQLMDMSLKDIKSILEYNDLESVITLLNQAEKNANDKIKKLKDAKKIISRAKKDYEKKLNISDLKNVNYEQSFPERKILISNVLSHPTLDNLWQYHRHFYEQLNPNLKDEFSFDDIAGIYTEHDVSLMFAVCRKYQGVDGLKTLAKGLYLCADCREQDREDTISQLLNEVERRSGVKPSFVVQIIVVTGILQWDYQIQVLIKSEK